MKETRLDDWPGRIAPGSAFSESFARDLLEHGFVVIPGPVPPADMPHLADAYDAAMTAAAPEDVSIGRATTRVHDLVNRGAEFDRLYVYPPVLDACVRTIGRPFRLGSLLARTLWPGAPSQALHIDFPGDGDGWPMVGFILMVDTFGLDNGATRFVPGSHRLPTTSGGAGCSLEADHEDEVQACGPAGSVIVYNGSVRHGHTANSSAEPRRSIQGAYIRRDAKPTVDLTGRMSPETYSRLGPVARYLLELT